VAGASLALLKGIAPRSRTFLATVTAASVLSLAAWLAFALRLGTAGDPRAWLPLPILAAAFFSEWLRPRDGARCGFR